MTAVSHCELVSLIGLDSKDFYVLKLHNRVLTSLGRVRLSLAQSFELPKTWWLPRLEDAWFTSGINEATRRLGTMAPNFIALVSQYFWGRHLFFWSLFTFFSNPWSLFSSCPLLMHYYQDTLQLRLQTIIRLNEVMPWMRGRKTFHYEKNIKQILVLGKIQAMLTLLDLTLEQLVQGSIEWIGFGLMLDSLTIV